MDYKTTEQLKQAMYEHARTMRNDPYHDGLHNLCYRLQDAEYVKFGNALESYLERLSRDAESNAARLDASLAHTEVCQAEMEKLQRLIAAACADNRDNWNEIYRLRSELKEVREERDQLETNNARGCGVVMEIWEDKKALRVELEAARENTRVALAQGQEYQDRMNAVDREFHLLTVANLAAGKELREANRLLGETHETAKRQRQSIGQLKNDRNNAQANETRLRAVVAELRQKLSEARKSQPAIPTQTESENAVYAPAGRKLDGSQCNHVHYVSDYSIFCPECGVSMQQN